MSLVTIRKLKLFSVANYSTHHEFFISIFLRRFRIVSKLIYYKYTYMYIYLYIYAITQRCCNKISVMDVGSDLFYFFLC